MGSREMRVNRQLLLEKRPIGEPAPDDFVVHEARMSRLGDGEALVKVLQVSLDPAMRGWMREPRAYGPPIALGEVMHARGAGVVMKSRTGKLRVGDHVVGMLGVQEYRVASAEELTKIDTEIAPVSTHLGALGLPGLTAYFGLTEVGDLHLSETVVVSGAAGAVGSVAGQLAKLLGASRVVGLAGGPRKCSWLLDDLGFDVAIDYKTESVSSRLHEVCPDGVDLYFDNVGGEVLDAALANLGWGARVALCGNISRYNAEGGTWGPGNYMMLVVRRARMQGFIVSDYVESYSVALNRLTSWYGEGKLKAREHIVDGSVEDFQATLIKLFRGENIGKLVLRIASH